jgi:hypothetical protein
MRDHRSFEFLGRYVRGAALLLALACPRIAWAEPPTSPTDSPGTLEPERDARPEEPLTGPLPDLTDDAIDARLRFLETRLRRDFKLLALWQIGFTGVYGGGLLYETGNAVIAQSTAERADNVVGAVKSAVGLLSRLAQPPAGMSELRPLLALPNKTRLDRVNRLVAAEALLKQDARDSDRRYHWLPHTINAALNLAGGLIVWLGYHDLARGAQSAGIGFAVGELQIWTRPWQGKRAWAEYRRTYGTTVTSMSGAGHHPTRPAVGVKLAVTSLGLTF